MKKILPLLIIAAGLYGCSSGGSSSPPPSSSDPVPVPPPTNTANEIEPNNSTTLANPVTLVDNAIILRGSVDSDFFNSGLYDNKDYFSFALSTDATVTLSLANADPLTQDIDIYVLDQNGTDYASDTSHGTPPLLSNVKLAAGVIWYVEVKAYLTDTTTSYALTITPSP